MPRIEDLRTRIELGLEDRSTVIFECDHEFTGAYNDDECDHCPAILGEDACLPDRPDTHLYEGDRWCSICGEWEILELSPEDIADIRADRAA